MKIRLKRWHKISLISIASLTVILILFNIWLNGFVRRNLEESFNSMLDAKVTIEKVRVNFFSGSVKILGLYAIGNNEFSKDTLLSFETLTLKAESFNRKEKKIVFKEIKITDLDVKAIFSDKGKSCWEKIQKKGGDAKQKDEFEDYSILIKSISLESANITVINRQKNEIQQIKNLNISILSSEEAGKTISEFNAAFNYKNEYTDIENFGLNGKVTLNDKNILADANILFDGFPLKLNLDLNTDSLPESISKLKLEVDFANLPKTSNNLYKGKLAISASSKGLFSSNPEINFAANIIADSVIFRDKTNNSSLIADFNVELNYEYSQQRNIKFASEKVFLLSGIDTLAGSFNFAINDTILIANSNLAGSFSFDILNNIFKSSTFLPKLNLNISSNLSGTVNSKENNLNGEFTSNLNLNAELFKIPEHIIKFNKDVFEVKTSIVSEYLVGSFNYSMKNFKNIFATGQVKQEINADISFISIPETNKSFALEPAMMVNDFSYNLSEKTDLSVNIAIDTIKITDKFITDINTNIKFIPQLTDIANCRMTIGEGRFSGFAKMTKEDTVWKSEIDFHLKDLNLNFFNDEKTEISGIVNFDIKDSFYTEKDSTFFSKNIGLNSFSIKDFRYKTSLMRDYDIAEDYIIVDDCVATVSLNKDIISFDLNKTEVNDIELNAKGKYNFISDEILVTALMYVPKKYISAKLKLALAVFSEKSEKEIPKRANMSSLILKVDGSLDNPKFHVYE